MAYDKNRMQDISLAEKPLWLEFNSYWASGDITSALAILTNNPNLEYKVLNAFNYNRLQNLINDATDISTATEDSLVGKWNLDYADLESASTDFKYIGIWNSGTAYKKNNLVKFNDYLAYFCIADNTNQSPPNATYWILAQEMLESIGIPVADIEPAGLRVGDVWFDTGTIFYGLSRTTTETTVVVMRNGVAINDGATVLLAGDVLTITATPVGETTLETLTVNGTSFTSGSTYTVFASDVNIVAVSAGVTYVLTDTSLGTWGGGVALMDSSDNSYYPAGTILPAGTIIKVEVSAITTGVDAYLDGGFLGSAYFGESYYTFELSGNVTMSNLGDYAIYITQTP